MGKHYLQNVLDDRLPVNNQVLYNLQTILNLLPNLNVEELIRAMMVKTNDMHLVIYISSLIRCVIQLHDLVNNKLAYKEDDFAGEQDAKPVMQASSQAVTTEPAQEDSN